MAESYYSHLSYSYALNHPIGKIDPNGIATFGVGVRVGLYEDENDIAEISSSIRLFRRIRKEKEAKPQQVLDGLNDSLRDLAKSLAPIRPLDDGEPQSIVKEVKHYLACDEFEMAFEGIFLEIMQLEKVSNIDLRQGLKVGQSLKLNEGTVFDIKFWEESQYVTMRLCNISRP